MSQNLVAVCYKVLRYIEACRSKGAQLLKAMGA